MMLRTASRPSGKALKQTTPIYNGKPSTFPEFRIAAKDYFNRKVITATEEESDESDESNDDLPVGFPALTRPKANVGAGLKPSNKTVGGIRAVKR